MESSRLASGVQPPALPRPPQLSGLGGIGRAGQRLPTSLSTPPAGGLLSPRGPHRRPCLLGPVWLPLCPLSCQEPRYPSCLGGPMGLCAGWGERGCRPCARAPGLGLCAQCSSRRGPAWQEPPAGARPRSPVLLPLECGGRGCRCSRARPGPWPCSCSPACPLTGPLSELSEWPLLCHP